MKKSLFVSFSVAMVFSLLVGSTAMAAGPDTSPPPDVDRGIPGLNLPPGGWRIFDVVARTLNLIPTELFEALHGGQTLPEIAEAQGVEMSEIRKAVREAFKAMGKRPPEDSRPFRLPFGGWAVFDAVADVLRMTPTELFEALHGGQTLAQIAEAQGVEMSEIREAVEAAQKRVARAAILKALEEGKITQEHADWMIVGLENGWRFPPRGHK